MKKWKNNEKEYLPFLIGIGLLILSINSFIDSDFIGESTFRGNRKMYFTPIIEFFLGGVLVFLGYKKVK